MSKFEKNLSFEDAVDPAIVTDSSVPWKERIVDWMISQPEAAHTAHEILAATDPKYDPKSSNKKFHFQARKHCLDSQLTYIRADYDIKTLTTEEDKIVLLGMTRELPDSKDPKKKVKRFVPFSNAKKYLSV